MQHNVRTCNISRLFIALLLSVRVTHILSVFTLLLRNNKQPLSLRWTRSSQTFNSGFLVHEWDYSWCEWVCNGICRLLYSLLLLLRVFYSYYWFPCQMCICRVLQLVFSLVKTFDHIKTSIRSSSYTNHISFYSPPSITLITLIHFFITILSFLSFVDHHLFTQYIHAYSFTHNHLIYTFIIYHHTVAPEIAPCCTAGWEWVAIGVRVKRALFNLSPSLSSVHSPILQCSDKLRKWSLSCIV
jgi:hypothetical protein